MCFCVFDVMMSSQFICAVKLLSVMLKILKTSDSLKIRLYSNTKTKIKDLI